ncbi:LysR family transcriptional regulator [Cohnella candidum]|uniref:LysR family transcriptional regulator n=1 Tax=Cohnella candidum TaxID=2674991 RepID=A0A3G3JSK8_9BACL|nr:LysR family transcriptional regulator [Cohnella candidum]AYQ71184.1 LysR family transcriptional regulator [Cohnella candidum]
MITIQQMKSFIETAETGSLTKAARNLFVSQPALTKQIAAMEKALGCTLLLRRTSGVELTEAGRYLFDRAQAIVGLYEQTLQGLDGLLRRSPLRIGALPSLASHYLPELAAALQEALGRETAVTVGDTSRELADKVLRGTWMPPSSKIGPTASPMKP